MKMRLIGDLHGDFRAYLALTDGVENSVQVGDFGLGFNKPPKMPLTHRHIRGNHDSPELCKISPNWIPDGHVEKTDLGNTIMYIGGALSIDRYSRLPGAHWWFDEELNEYELEDLYKRYQEVKPDIMVTHDCPEDVKNVVIDEYSGKKMITKTTFWLQEMFNAHSPKLWLFGHHHKKFGRTIKDTNFVCLDINCYIDVVF